MIRNMVIFVTLSALFSFQAKAITAVCTDAKGRISGIHGKAFGGKEFDETDGISKATFTLIWNSGEKEARIVSQNAGGGTPTTEHGLLVFDTDEQLTFIVLYESAIWFYSFFPGSKALIMTSHNNGVSIDSGGAVVKSFLARCEIGK